MILNRTKLFHNKYFDIRSYELEKAQKSKEDIVCIHLNRKMTLSSAKQKEKKLVFDTTAIKSKINIGQKYYIYSYLFEPDKRLTADEEAEKLSRECL